MQSKSDQPDVRVIDTAHLRAVPSMVGKRARLAARYQHIAESLDACAIAPRTTTGPIPMSSGQRRLWLLAQIEPDTAAYNVRDIVRIRGPLDGDALARALDAFAQRHESLRTSFEMVDGEPVQRISPTAALVIERCDVNDVPPAERAARAEAIAVEAAERPFDLRAGAPIRATLVRIDDDDHVFVLVRHHIINDAWSNGIIYRELASLYRFFHDGTPHGLAALVTQYADFTLWQRDRLASDVAARDLAYWKEHLAGAPPLVDIAGDRPRPAVQTYAGATERIVIDGPTARGLEHLARRQHASPFMVLLAAFNVLLAHYTRTDDIVVGTPIANRQLPELEPIVGFFINTLALRTRVRADDDFCTVLENVREVALEAFDHQDVPFERLVEELHPDRSLGHAPIVNVFFVMHGDEHAGLRFHGVETEPIAARRDTAKFDLSLHARATGAGLECAFEYNRDLFDAATIRRLLDALRTMLTAIVDRPHAPVGRLPLVDATEGTRIVHDFNAQPVKRTTVPAAFVTEAFEAHAARAPHAVALRFGTQTLTYGALNARANRVARRLRACGAGANVPVGICIDRSFDMVAGVLGILKAGAAYLPLDPAYPPERLATMATHAPLLLAQRRHLGVLPSIATAIAIDDDPAIETQDGHDLDVRPSGDDLAYVITTSGSTGTPKGVAMPHRALTNLLAWQIDRFAHDAPGPTLQFASLSFDVSFQEIFSALGTGGELVLVTDEERRDLSALLDIIVRERIGRVFLPFVALQHIVSVARSRAIVPRDVRCVVTAGEQLKISDDIRAFFAALPECRLDNQYGPSETHVASAAWLDGDPATWPALPPIGRPVAGLRLHVLDAQMQLVPVGAPGELYIGGMGLASGYLARPDLTAERFVADPFSDDPNDRLYRTGDLARYRDDGNLDFLGRADRQVKIRGFRIEPAEIEAALNACAIVRESAVVPLNDGDGGDAYLNAYVVLREPSADATRAVRRALENRLPAYMMPRAIVAVDALPQTTNGKLDARALATGAEPASNDVPPVNNPLHVQLIAIWQQVLGRSGIGIHDDFFQLGGHSLSAVVMMNALENAFGRRVPVAALFRGPTIASIAAHLRGQAHDDAVDRMIAVRATGSRPPLIFFHGDLNGGGYYSRRLLAHAGDDRPVYVFAPHGADGDPLPASIEAMAIENIDVLRRVQPHGPYVFGGFCNGGLVAFEMARRLQAAGERVDDVLLIDSGPWNARFSPLATALTRAFRLAGKSADAHVPAVGYVVSRLRTVRSVLEQGAKERRAFVVREITERFKRPTPAEPSDDALVEAWQQIGARYVPRPYSGHVSLFWPADKGRDAGERFANDWRRVARRAHSTPIAGDHLTCITEHVDELGVRFGAALSVLP